MIDSACIDTVPAPAWPALVAITAGHAHQWAPTGMTIRMGASDNTSVGGPILGSLTRRYACLLCGAVEDRPEAPTVATTVGEVEIITASLPSGDIVVTLSGARLVLSRATARALVSMLRSMLQMPVGEAS